jgi:hypothetical protein
MTEEKREIMLHTPGRSYKGYMDIGSKNLRTIDIFNSANMFWRDPAERSFDDALLMYNTVVTIEGGTKLGEYNKLQLKLADVLFFYDSLVQSGNENEKIRAATLKAKTKETAALVQITTHTRGSGFYHIQGMFHGLFKSKSKNRFIPLTEASVHAVTRVADKWKKKTINIENSFVGVGTAHIETCTFAKDAK